MSKLLLVCWFVIAVTIFVYSYGFVDFNLTLSSHPAVMSFVSWSQNLAMFHRSTSLSVYLGIIVILYLCYFGSVAVWHKANNFPWRWIIMLALVFAFSYPFLSSDVFKYLFAAKELLFYHANPHTVAPQVFEGDTWLRFMRWIHTPSPYGPVMTALAIPYYLLGFGKFVPTLYLFKLDQIFWYLLSIWVIGKIAPKRKVLAQLLFALNPLILVEWLVNAHNDAPMIALLLLSFYLLTRTKYATSFLSLALSVGIKYVTVFFLPAMLFYKKMKVEWITSYSLIVLALAPLLYHYSYQYQPWYVTWIIPFAAISGSPIVISLTIAYSLGSFLRYIPYISTGLWIGTPTTFALLSFTPIAITALYFLLTHWRKKPAIMKS
jgi:hypothetical protein